MTNGLQPLVELCMDGCFAGLCRLLPVQLVLAQKTLASAAILSVQCRSFHRSGRWNSLL